MGFFGGMYFFKYDFIISHCSVEKGYFCVHRAMEEKPLGYKKTLCSGDNTSTFRLQLYRSMGVEALLFRGKEVQAHFKLISGL